jgi:hypothetical protein
VGVGLSRRGDAGMGTRGAGWVEDFNRVVEALRQDRAPPRPLARSPAQLADVRLAAFLAGWRRADEVADPFFLTSLRVQLLL